MKQSTRILSKLEEQLWFQMKVTRPAIELPEREFVFDEERKRKFRFDFAWPDTILPGRPGMRLAAEVEGGIWNQGRHLRPVSFFVDCEKYNLAASQNWIVLRFTDTMISSLYAVKLIRQFLIGKGDDEWQ